MNLNELESRVAIREVAKELEVSLNTVRQWHFYGTWSERLPIRKGGNGRLYCMRKDLDSFKVFWLLGEEAEASIS